MKSSLSGKIHLFFYICFFWFFVFFCCLPVLGSDEERHNSNVLLITIDTIRPDRLGCYSQEHLQTVNIEDLAKNGVVFTRAFAHNSLTLPSHANILLGTTPLYHGVHDNSDFIVGEKFITLAEYLKNEGYATGSFIGAFPLDSRFGLDQGFDVYDDTYPTKPVVGFSYAERQAGMVIQKAIDWLKGQHSKWFTWIHIWDPHQPYDPPEPFKSRFYHDRYSGEVAYVDFELGKLFDFLDRSGLDKNTLIVLTGDHGESLGEHGESTHGYFAYNSTLWIPLIFTGPGLEPRRIAEYVSHIDIFPTVCDILGLEKPSFLQGVSLLPLISGGNREKKPIYFESLHAYYNRGWAPLKGFIDKEHKFIDSPIPEFYDLESDFFEKTNLSSEIDLENYKEIMEKIEQNFLSPHQTERVKKLDRDAQEKLESLGYISSFVPRLKKNFTPADDLKTLLPFQNKFTKAASLYEQDKTEEGIKLLEEVILEKKTFVLAYKQLASMYKSQGKIKKAVQTMEKALANNPKSFQSYATLGILLVEAGHLDKAIQNLQNAIALFGSDPEVWNYLGVAFWKKGDFQRALEAYQRVLLLDHNYALAYNNLGSLYLSMFMRSKKSEDYSQSLEYFKKAIELDPALSSALNGLASAYKTSGKINEAISLWEKSLELNPDYDFPLYNLGISYLEIGNKAQALKFFNEYLALKKNILSSEEMRKLEILIQECKKDQKNS